MNSAGSPSRPDPVALIVGLLLVFLAALLLTGAMRRYAVSRRLLDVPNSRSSHAVPTPTGGGVAIVIASLLSMFALGAAGVTSWSTVAAMAGGGAFVGAIGFIDDRHDLPAAWRLVAHFLAAAWLLAWMGALPVLSVWGVPITTGPIALAVAAIYVVWVLNLTNFMDGVDGLAAIEAVTVCGAGALLCYMGIPRPSAWMLPLFVAVAALGFFAWNRPPARIFMGDAGSSFLGFMFAALALETAREAPPLFWSWTILLGVFMVDATTTLVRRLIRGENVSSAHRSHAYQHAAVRYAAHGPVTVTAAAINMLWLLPMAWLVLRKQIDGVAGVLLAYAPLVVLAVTLGAGANGRRD
jgi:Fuc2NAc and GlcNAc transferase